MKIKVCGLKDAQNIKEVAAFAPDYMGFIFYQRSPRFIDGLDPYVVKNIDKKICKTGVFVNDSFDSINALIAEYGLDAVQLHGVENPEFCEGLKKRVKVIKAFGLGEDTDFTEFEDYQHCADFFLFDTKSDKPGGSGKTFNWNVIQKYKYDIPFFLSGGLSRENIREALKLNHPQFYGVDLNSRFEVAPGVKDVSALKQVFKIIRSKDQ